MRISLPRPRPWLEAALSLAVLLFLVGYSGAYLRSPAPGFDFDSNGRVDQITTVPLAGLTLMLGDQIVQIGPVTWIDYKEKQRPFFAGARPGQMLVVRVSRAGQLLDIPWVMPPVSLAQLGERLINIWPMAYLFWLGGIVAWLLVRPRDARWRLLVLFNFLTAVWIMAGQLSAARLLGSGLVLRAGIWLSVPVYWHLHWVFPRPLGRLPGWLIGVGYVVGVGLAVAQFGLLVPANAYFYGFVAAVLGSLALMVAHWVFRPTDRADLRLILLAAGAVFLPAAGLGLAGLLSGSNSTNSGVLLSLPVLPFAYVYAISRQRLGGLELRVNRAISFYLFLLILVPAAALVLALTTTRLGVEPTLAGVMTAALAVTLGVFGFTRFQNWVEGWLLRIPPRPERLLSVYVARTAASLDEVTLLGLIEQQVLPALLVQQSALVLVEGAMEPRVLYAEQVTAGDLPRRADLAALLTVAGRYRPPNTNGGPCPWARLVLPLTIDRRLMGIWLFGRRAPDDYYALGEVEALQALAQQTAIVLSHIAQTERLRRLYQANIDQRELERTRLARELHDDVLSGLAALMPFLDGPGLERLVSSLQATADRIRRTISDLRPAVLDHGLWYALANLVDELGEASPPGLEIRLEIPQSAARYDRQVEQHLYRIVQQACDNARTHGRAQFVRLQGALELDHLALSVVDNGVGFALDPGNSQDQYLSDLVTAGHYGLAGMVERARLIGADLGIEAAPGQGTRIQIRWQPKRDAEA